MTLKIIALITMTIDHLSYVLERQGMMDGITYYIGRGIGRFAFPIYVYLLLIGFYKTHSRIQYGLRLFLFSVLSEFSFNYFHTGKFWDTARQNVFFELFAIFFLYYIFFKTDEQKNWHVLFQGLIKAVTILAFGFWTTVLRFDYSYFGIALGVIFYLAYPVRKNKTICGFIMLLGMFLILPFYMWKNPLELLVLWEIPLLLFCNTDKKVQQPKIVKYGFYFYYPIHLLLLGVIFS